MNTDFKYKPVYTWLPWTSSFPNSLCLLVSTGLPVMVWIYGGGFLVGGSMGANFLDNYLYSGQEIAERGNVIVVTLGYRVGTLGFLSTGDSSLPGRCYTPTTHTKAAYGTLKRKHRRQNFFSWVSHSHCPTIRKLRPVGPASCYRLGPQEYPLIWRRPRQHHHLWGVCRWS